MVEPLARITGTRYVGKRLIHFDCLDSTNTYAMSLANDPANEGTVVMAGEQSAGRGQHGRTWTAPPRTSLLMSVLLFPPPPLRQPAALTAWAAVSVCQLIQQVTGLQPTIKWPNDVLIQGKKACGILIEQRSTRQNALATVAGIGLNVLQPAEWFRQAGLLEGASLAMFCRGDLDIEKLTERLILLLDAALDQLLGADLSCLESAWKSHLGLIGKQVIVEAPQAVQGKLLDISFAGLELSTVGGMVTFRPEAVRHIHVPRHQ